MPYFSIKKCKNRQEPDPALNKRFNWPKMNIFIWSTFCFAITDGTKYLNVRFKDWLEQGFTVIVRFMILRFYSKVTKNLDPLRSWRHFWTTYTVRWKVCYSFSTFWILKGNSQFVKFCLFRRFELKKSIRVSLKADVCNQLLWSIFLTKKIIHQWICQLLLHRKIQMFRLKIFQVQLATQSKRYNDDIAQKETEKSKMKSLFKVSFLATIWALFKCVFQMLKKCSN